MKLHLVVAAVLALVTAFAAPVNATHPAAHSTVTVPSVEPATSVQLPAGDVLTVSTVTVVGQVARKHVAPAPKRFVCGEMHDNFVGGRNADCSWQ